MFKKLLIIVLLVPALALAGNSIDAEFSKSVTPLKGKIYAQYNKLLKSSPGLEGKLVLDIYVNSSGNIETCNVGQSEIREKGFIRNVCQLLKSKTYQQISKKPTRITYSMDFLQY